MSATSHFSRSLFYLVLLLTIIGLVVIADASSVSAFRDFGNRWYYLKLQSIWAAAGLAFFFISSRLPLSRLEKAAFPLFIMTLVSLVVVLIPHIGTQLLGARRWLSLGPLSFQPAELAKVTTALYIAHLFKSRPQFSSLLLISLSLGGLIMLEPDMGTTMVILGMCLITYFASGGRITWLVFAAPVAIALVGILIFSSPYRTARLKTFLDHSSDPLGASYQVRQALIGLGSGGLWGVGLGQSRQKYDFLPEVTTDSILAVVGEELGLFGTSFLLLSFLALTLSGLKLATSTSDRFSSTLAIAISSWIGLQAFTNISSIVALIPFTGIPLPFISYGGSALLVTLSACGLLYNIARHTHA